MLQHVTTVQYRFCQIRGTLNPYFVHAFCPQSWDSSGQRWLWDRWPHRTSRTVVQQFLKLNTPINGPSLCWLWMLSRADLNHHFFKSGKWPFLSAMVSGKMCVSPIAHSQAIMDLVLVMNECIYMITNFALRCFEIPSWFLAKPTID